MFGERKPFSEADKDRVESLKASLRNQREIGGDRSAFARNGAIARNIMEQDAGQYGHTGHDYGLDELLRDQNIVHTRQDAAHAVLNTGTILKQIRVLRWLVIVLLILCAYLALKVH